jgi:hypothetical protein
LIELGKYHDNELLKPFTDIVSVKSDNPKLSKIAIKKFNILNNILKDEFIFNKNFKILGSDVKISGYGGLGKINIVTPTYHKKDIQKVEVNTLLGKLVFFNDVVYYNFLGYSTYPLVYPQYFLSVSANGYNKTKDEQDNIIIVPSSISKDLEEYLDHLSKVFKPNYSNMVVKAYIGDKVNVCYSYLTNKDTSYRGNIAYIYDVVTSYSKSNYAEVGENHEFYTTYSGGSTIRYYIEIEEDKRIYLPYTRYSHYSGSSNGFRGVYFNVIYYYRTDSSSVNYSFNAYSISHLNYGNTPDDPPIVVGATTDYIEDTKEFALFYVENTNSSTKDGGHRDSPPPANSRNYVWDRSESSSTHTLKFNDFNIFSGSSGTYSIKIMGYTDCHMNFLVCENGKSAGCLGANSPSARISKSTSTKPVITEFGEFGGIDWACYKRKFGDWLYSLLFKVYHTKSMSSKNVCYKCYCPTDPSTSWSRCYWLPINTDFCKDIECTKCATDLSSQFSSSGHAVHYLYLPNHSIKEVCRNDGNQYTDRFGTIHAPTGEFVWQYSWTMESYYLLTGDSRIPFLYRETPSIDIYDISNSYLGILFDTVTVIQYIILDTYKDTHRFGVHVYFTYKDKPASQGILFSEEYSDVISENYKVSYDILPFDSYDPKDNVDPNIRYHPENKVYLLIQPFNYFYKGEPIYYEIKDNRLDFPNLGIELKVMADENISGINVYMFNFDSSGELDYENPYKWIGTSFKDENNEIKFVVRWNFPFKYSSEETANGLLYYGFNWGMYYNNAIGVLSSACEKLAEVALQKFTEV